MFGQGSKLTEQEMKWNNVKWLGQVLRMPGDRLSWYALFHEAGNGWKMGQSGWPMTWRQGVKTLP